MRQGIYARYIKRILDILLSGGALIVLSPVMLILSILVRLKLGSPVFFSQERPGFHEKIFRMYKFRTMTNAKDSKGKLLSDAQRRTNFGQMLRSTSLDELPELFNIFKGDMSLIGPRPLLVKYLPYYTEEERIRHQVRPGLTGYAQIHGRNTCIWEKRFQYDREYAENLSFKMDLKIIYMTIQNVLKGSGIVAPGELEDFDEYRKKQYADSRLQAVSPGNIKSDIYKKG